MRTPYRWPLAGSLFVSIVLAFQLAAGDYDGSVLRVKSAAPYAEPGVEGWGSAVAVDLSEFGLKGKYLLSASHVVHGMARVEAEIDAHWTVATVVYEDEDYDICIMKIEGAIKPLPLGRAVPEALVGVGFKWGLSPPAVSNGVCTGTSTNHNKAQWRAALAVGPGCSGGAVLTRDGKIAGIVIAGLAGKDGGMREDVTIFVPCTILRQWIEAQTK